VKKPQWISVGVAILAVIIILIFGQSIPLKKPVANEGQTVHEDHEHKAESGPLTIDSILLSARKTLSNE